MKKQQKKQQFKPTIINFILDETGSMGAISDSVISGFNEYVQSLQKKKEKFLFTLTKFDSEGIRTPYVAVDVKKVEKLTHDTYRPGAMTPLYDACVYTIEKVAEEVSDDQPSLVVIMTDGEENSSTKHNQKCLHNLITKLKGKGNWTFVFMGANQDSWATAQAFGIDKGNVMDWQANAKGARNAMRNLSNATVMYAASVSGGGGGSGILRSDSFFDKVKGGDVDDSRP